MAMHGTRLRSVFVDGVEHVVPTGVSWARKNRYWGVSRLVDGVQLWWRFYPGDYRGSVAEALAAAKVKAHDVRHNQEKDATTLRNVRCLGSNPPLPRGIFVHRSRSEINHSEYKLVVKKVGEFKSKTFRVGLVHAYTQQQYNDALAQALAYLQQIVVASVPELQESDAVSREELEHALRKLERSKLQLGQFPSTTFSHSAA